MDAVSFSSATSGQSQALAAKAYSKTSTQKSGRTDADFEATAQEFESMFMAQMLQPMFSGLGVDDTFGGGHGEEMMRGLLTQEYGKAMAANDTSGLSTAIKDQLIRMQEEADRKGMIS